jgi:hypothetical protein
MTFLVMTPHLNAITLSIRFQHVNLEETNIQTIASSFLTQK